MSPNPFASTLIPNEWGGFGAARQVRAGFLYGVIEFDDEIN
jgi:hypothetical protein